MGLYLVLCSLLEQKERHLSGAVEGFCLRPPLSKWLLKLSTKREDKEGEVDTERSVARPSPAWA